MNFKNMISENGYNCKSEQINFGEFDFWLISARSCRVYRPKHPIPTGFGSSYGRLPLYTVVGERLDVCSINR